MPATFAEFTVFCMCSYPADKQVNLERSKMIFTNHPVVISTKAKIGQLIKGSPLVNYNIFKLYILLIYVGHSHLINCSDHFQTVTIHHGFISFIFQPYLQLSPASMSGYGLSNYLFDNVKQTMIARLCCCDYYGI